MLTQSFRPYWALEGGARCGGAVFHANSVLSSGLFRSMAGQSDPPYLQTLSHHHTFRLSVLPGPRASKNLLPYTLPPIMCQEPFRMTP